MRGDSQHVEHSSEDTRSEDCVARMSRTVSHVNSSLESMPFLAGHVSNGDEKTNQRLL